MHWINICVLFLLLINAVYAKLSFKSPQIQQKESYDFCLVDSQITSSSQYHFADIQSAIYNCPSNKIVCLAPNTLATNITLHFTNIDTTLYDPSILHINSCILSGASQWNLQVEALSIEYAAETSSKSKYRAKRQTISSTQPKYNQQLYRQHSAINTILFSNVTFNGLESRQSLFANAPYNIVLENCTVHDYLHSSFLDVQGRANITINNCTFINTEETAIHLTEIDQYQITNNTFINTGDETLYIKLNMLYDTSSVLSNNLFSLNTAIHLFNLQNATIQNNRGVSFTVQGDLSYLCAQSKREKLYTLKQLYLCNPQAQPTTLQSLNPALVYTVDPSETPRNVDVCRIAKNSDISVQLQGCDSDEVVLESGIYEENAIQFSRDTLSIVCEGTCVIFGSGHTLHSRNLIVEGIRFVHSGEPSILLFEVTQSVQQSITLRNNEFVGMSIEIGMIISNSVPLHEFIFEYNTVENFYLDAIRLNINIETVWIENNIFLNCFGRVISIESVSVEAVVQDNEFVQCRGVSRSGSITAIVSIEKEWDASLEFNRNSVQSYGLGSREINDIAYSLTGDNIDAERINNNECQGTAYGLVIEGADTDRYLQLETTNGGIRNNFVSDISFLNYNTDSMTICKIPCSMYRGSEETRCYVNTDYNTYTQYYGFTRFSSINTAIEQCPFGYEIVLQSMHYQEQLYINKDVFIHSEMDGDDKPTIYGHNHLINTANVIIQDIDFCYSVQGSATPLRKELFLSEAATVITHLQFENVDFVGDYISAGIRLDVMNIELSRDALFIMNNCSVYNWPSLHENVSYDATTNTLVLENGDRVSPNEASTGGRVWVKFNRKPGESRAIITGNYFERVDGTCLRIENPNNWQVNSNVFIDCGGRRKQEDSVVILKANSLETTYSREYTFSSNHCNQSLTVLFPTAGGFLQPYYVSSYWLFDFLYTPQLEWTFSDNYCFGQPVGTRFSYMDKQIIRSSLLNATDGNYVQMNLLSDLAEISSNCNVNGTLYDFLVAHPISSVVESDSTLQDDNYCPYTVDTLHLVKGINSTSCKCPVGPPATCIVDKDNTEYNDYHPYYGTWLFTNIMDAVNDCVDPYKRINVRYSDSPYTETLIFARENMTLFSVDGAEVSGSSHVVSSNNITVDGLCFRHIGAHSTIVSSENTTYAFSISNSRFEGLYTQQQAVSGTYKNLEIHSTLFHQYSGVSVDVVDANHTSICNCTFTAFLNCAVQVHTEHGYTILNNTLIDNADDTAINNGQCALYANTVHPRHIRFINNKYYYCEEMTKDVYLTIRDSGMKSAFWLNNIESRSEIYSNSASGYIAVALRVSNIKDDSAKQKELQQISSEGLNGLWHDVVKGLPENDHAIDTLIFDNSQYICDAGCTTNDFILIGILALACAFICCFVCCIIACGSRPVDQSPKMVWNSVLGGYIPRDPKYWDDFALPRGDCNDPTANLAFGSQYLENSDHRFNTKNNSSTFVMRSEQPGIFVNSNN